MDVSTGAFVLAQWRGVGPAMGLFDVVSACRSAVPMVPDPGRPEAVLVEQPPRVVGRLRRRLAERHLRPLLLPTRSPLLGFAGSTVPYWTLAGDRPSLCLVAPAGGPAVVRSETGLGCRFGWRGVQEELPLADAAPALVPAMDRSGRTRLSGAPLAEAVGFVPRRLLIALSPPRDGVCHKVAAALLP